MICVLKMKAEISVCRCIVGDVCIALSVTVYVCVCSISDLNVYIESTFIA